MPPIHLNRRNLLKAAAVAPVTALPIVATEADAEADVFRHYVEGLMREWEPMLPTGTDHYALTIKRAFGPTPDLRWFEVDSHAGQFGGPTRFWSHQNNTWVRL